MRVTWRPCLKPGCPTLVRSGYCEEHASLRWDGERQRATKRMSSYRWVYKDPRWEGTRRAVLRRDPWCMHCGKDASTDVDHIEPLREILAAQGDPFDPAACQGLCKRCHSKKTRREMRGERVA